MNPDWNSCYDCGPGVPLRLRTAWETYYLSRGVSSLRAYVLANKKARKGKQPPDRIVDAI